MSAPRKTILVLMLMLVIGFAAIYQLTAGFQAFASEDLRRIDVARQPRTLPDADAEFASGSVTRLAHALRKDGRVAIVAFIYTRCNAVCAALGTEFQQLQHTIQEKKLGDRVRLLSISFDAADAPDELARYASSLHADPAIWDFAAIPDARRRGAMLDAFGIIVVPAPFGQFQHNAAFHVVTPVAQLARIIDFDMPDQALAQALALSRTAPQGQ
ncbi:protein SCO1/2 [Collimonas sp. OK307]|uniref:SCO family protein n=1 Tax=Collimonas sp. OK307 TaxID=1801620 RepID=UPI0008F1CE46|nr:SCO family protein [Collimonas sp. OK307]SFI32546.1 protein SCO1/2 [Collimonas sp. OK307]